MAKKKKGVINPMQAELNALRALKRSMSNAARLVGVTRQMLYDNTSGVRTPRKVMFMKGVITLLREKVHGHTETPLLRVHTSFHDLSCTYNGYTASATISITEVKDATGLDYVRVADTETGKEIKIYGNEGIQYFPSTLVKEKVA